LIIAAAAWVLPLYWLTTTAFKPETEIAAAPTLWPSRWTLANFAHIWRAFLRPALNSFIVSGACTILIVLINSHEKRTLQLALAALREGYEATPWGQVMAATVITIICRTRPGCHFLPRWRGSYIKAPNTGTRRGAVRLRLRTN